jgi:hypothetical protein
MPASSAAAGVVRIHGVQIHELARICGVGAHRALPTILAAQFPGFCAAVFEPDSSGRKAWMEVRSTNRTGGNYKSGSSESRSVIFERAK